MNSDAPEFSRNEEIAILRYKAGELRQCAAETCGLKKAVYLKRASRFDTVADEMEAEELRK